MKLALSKPLLLVSALLLLSGCRAHAGSGALTLTSPELAGGRVARQCSCQGAGTSPALHWSAPPAGAVSLALVVTDPDAPGRTFTHWVLYDLPPATRDLPTGLPKSGQLPDGSRQGLNDFGAVGYGPPCPPGGASHRYIFTLYALNTRLNLPAGATLDQVRAAIKGHDLAKGELIALFP